MRTVWDSASDQYVTYIDLDGDICNCEFDAAVNEGYMSMNTFNREGVDGVGVLRVGGSVEFIDYGLAAQPVAQITPSMGPNVPVPLSISAETSHSVSISAEGQIGFDDGPVVLGTFGAGSEKGSSHSYSETYPSPLVTATGNQIKYAYWAPVFKATLSQGTDESSWSFKYNLHLSIESWIPVVTTTLPGNIDIMDHGNE